MYLFFDTETNDLPKNWKAPVSDLNNWPRLLQLSCLLYDENQELIEEGNYYVKSPGIVISEKAFDINKLTVEFLEKKGIELLTVLEKFKAVIEKADYLIAHNISFDENIVGSEFLRNGMENLLENKGKVCTMLNTVDFCKIKGNFGFKWTKLEELYFILFNEKFEGAHDSLKDTKAMAKCFWKMIELEVI